MLRAIFASFSKNKENPATKARSRASFVDIVSSNNELNGVVQLSEFKRGRRLYRTAEYAIRISLALGAIWLLVLGSVSAPTTTIFAATPAEERAALERQLEELEAQMDEYQSQIQEYEKQGKTLSGEISRLNAQVSKLNLQIRAVNLTLSQLSRQISDTQTKIVDTETSLEEKEKALIEFIQRIYEAEDLTLVEVFLKNPSLASFFDDLNNLSLLQENLHLTIGQIKDLRNSLASQKEELTLARADTETIRRFQEAQRAEVDRAKSEKNKLLVVTKGEEEKYQNLLKETEKSAAEIRSRLFELLGGGELSFEAAYNYAKLASSATGVRPALILAVLDKESALGSNVGRCDYQGAMHPTRDIPAFLEITAKLGISPDSVKVSCPILSDGAYGGAMGPAQFIPSTWQIYESSIEKVTGREPANPWNNADAFIATGLYLRDSYNSSGCRSYADENDHILPHQMLQERCAAAKYYAGGNWHRFRFLYGDPVIERAQSFEKDIAIITQ